MTTIAYRDGVLAADGLCTCNGGVLSTRMRKIGAKGAILWSSSGDTSWAKTFRDWVSDGLKGEYPKPPDDRTGGIIYLPNGDIVVFHQLGVEHRPGLPFWADGSGADYALGAMQAGATAEEAVRAAMVWDTGTGGEIFVLKAN